MIINRTVKCVTESGGLKVYAVETYSLLFIPIYTNKVQVK